MKWFIHCAVLTKDGIGEVHLHKRWWSRKVCEVFYIPEGTSTAHQVPVTRLSELVHCASAIEAMAVIRR